MKKAIKTILLVLLALIVLAGCYFAYVFIDYYRIEDNLVLEIKAPISAPAMVGTDYTIISYNIGFGAYSDDYSFFLDGGKYSRAFSQEAVNKNTSGALTEAAALLPNLLLLQEVDIDSIRSYHVDQRELVYKSFPGYTSNFSQNYDSPYLLYPILSPHGKSVSGIMTLSDLQVDSALRRSLPVEKGFMKMLDLDRCYSVSRIPVDNGKTLCLYNLHLSAYSSDGSIATEQLKLLLADMAAEYEAGNYALAGGDFNKDLLGNSPEIFGGSDGENQVWAQPFPFDLLPEELSLVAPLNEESPVPSNRCADAPFDPSLAFVLTLDGFIVSDNIEVNTSSVINTGFKWSDHNPVSMAFKLS